MNTCKKCGNHFPSKKIIDGKLRYLHVRSYCLDCSPFNEKRGYLLRKQATDAEYAAQNNIRVLTCKICSKDFTVGRKSNHICTNCRCWHRRYLNRKQICDLLGNKCARCGFNDVSILQLHHINPQTKHFDFSDRWHLGIKTLITESKKCILLCPNCHAKEHTHHRQDVLDYYSKTT